jgi:hypothetical protein
MRIAKDRARGRAEVVADLIAVIALFVAIFDLVAADRKFAIISALIGDIGVGEPFVTLLIGLHDSVTTGEPHGQ